MLLTHCVHGAAISKDSAASKADDGATSMEIQESRLLYSIPLQSGPLRQAKESY